ncbi:hypothetical protein [Evansella tamaricis]|uniref:Phage protein n=1 Tax=Evansella tamaricis TaxID=2069301 RepID=A0ABS6JCZ6_9BACI|nr:hypothetical protein [Evansella tamaricis]MBU9711069.1 hypothetical protein [Evansella tamaricis]
MLFNYKNVDQATQNLEGPKFNSFLPLDLQYFNGGGDPPPSDPPADPPQDPPGGGNKPPQDPPKDPEGGGEPTKTFTQEDVNNLIAKETRKQQEKILKDLGIDDFKNAKEGMKKFQDWQESQKTEAQKQQEKLQDLENNYNTTSQENQSLKAQLAALKTGVQSDSVEDVVALAERLVSDEVSLDEAINQVIEKYPHFKGETQKQEDKSTQKPSFVAPDHKRTEVSDLDKWKEAFK